MIKKIKKIMVVAIVGVLCFGTLFGCGSKYYPEYESEFYRYAVRRRDDGTKGAYLVGLTEEGAKQTELVYPEKLNGITVYGIGYTRYGMVTAVEAVGRFESNYLKKLFFPKMMMASISNLGQIMYLNDNSCVVYWNLGRGEKIDRELATVFGYNYVMEGKSLNTSSKNGYIGNVSYLHNYDNAPDKGYYWVDSYDESVITFIPPTPNRDGYRFGGWYKEAECTNKWDFETEVTGKEFLIDKESLDNNYRYHGKYEGIYLYAKWTKN